MNFKQVNIQSVYVDIAEENEETKTVVNNWEVINGNQLKIDISFMLDGEKWANEEGETDFVLTIAPALSHNLHFEGNCNYFEEHERGYEFEVDVDGKDLLLFEESGTVTTEVIITFQ